jgi:hypothetical protein
LLNAGSSDSLKEQFVLEGEDFTFAFLHIAFAALSSWAQAIQRSLLGHGINAL